MDFEDVFNDDYFKRMDNYHQRLHEKFESLNMDRCAIVPEVGDIVVVAGGLLGMGHDWILHEAVVIETGSQTYKVLFTNYRHFDGRESKMWIHPALIVDVIKKEKVEQ